MSYVMGDFNNWKRSNDENSQMYYDESAGCWWITLSGLEPTKEYAFNIIWEKKSSVEGEKDTELRIADPYTEKILDASSDSYIPNPLILRPNVSIQRKSRSCFNIQDTERFLFMGTRQFQNSR